MSKLMILGTHVYIQGFGWTVLEKEFGCLRLDDSYRIQKINKNEFWLYNLKDATFKLKVKCLPAHFDLPGYEVAGD